MKKAIEKLEGVKDQIKRIYFDGAKPMGIVHLLGDIDNVIAALQAPPRWETPEQWEKRTGEQWPDDWAVYALQEDLTWAAMPYFVAKVRMNHESDYLFVIAIICATEAGPPPDGWRPEEDKQDFDILPPPGENLFDGFGSHGDIRGEKPLTSPDG
jgi:hypothetical protein